MGLLVMVALVGGGLASLERRAQGTVAARALGKLYKVGEAPIVFIPQHESSLPVDACRIPWLLSNLCRTCAPVDSQELALLGLVSYGIFLALGAYSNKRSASFFASFECVAMDHPSFTISHGNACA